MTEPDRQLLIDAGPQGAATAGHGHADALSLCLNLDGQPVLIDPGTCEYVGSNNDRQKFRGTSSHNTLQVDAADQAEPAGPFGWTRLPHVQAERWIIGESFDLFQGSHNGYCRFPSPVSHRRWVFSRKGEFYLIRDRAEGNGQHRLDLFWHLAPVGAQGLRVVPVQGHGWQEELVPSSWSPVYGRQEPAPVLHFGTVANLPAEFVTLLVPGRAGVGELSAVRAQETGSVRGYRYRTSKEVHWAYFAAGPRWTLGPWSSDAEFLYWCAGGESRHLIFCRGSFVEFAGESLVTAQQILDRCELAATGTSTSILAPSPESISIHRPLTSVPAEPEPAAVVNSLPVPGGESI
jgi:hypothetical protein